MEKRIGKKREKESQEQGTNREEQNVEWVVFMLKGEREKKTEEREREREMYSRTGFVGG